MNKDNAKTILVILISLIILAIIFLLARLDMFLGVVVGAFFMGNGIAHFAFTLLKQPEKKKK